MNKENFKLVDERVENFIELLETNDKICLNAEFGAGKTYFKDRVLDNLQSNSKKNERYAICEINAITHQNNIPLEIIKLLNPHMKFPRFISTNGIGAFFYKWKKSMSIFIALLIPILVSFWLERIINEDISFYNFKNYKFDILIAFTLVGVAVLFSLLLTVFIKVGDLNELTYLKPKKGMKFLFIIEDLNRIEKEKQYDFLNKFLIAFEKVSFKKHKNYEFRKKLIILMDLEQFHNSENIELLKNFDHQYNLKYNIFEMREILSKIVSDKTKDNNIKKSGVRVFEILKNSRKTTLNTNEDFLFLCFRNIRVLNHIVDKLFNFCKIEGFIEKINKNELFDIILLEYLDPELYGLILNNPGLLFENYDNKESLDFAHRIDPKNVNKYLKIILDDDKNIIKKYDFFKETLFKEYGKKYPIEEFCNTLSITEKSTFEIFINHSYSKYFNSLLNKIDLDIKDLKSYNTLILNILLNKDDILQILNCNSIPQDFFVLKRLGNVYNSLSESYVVQSIDQFKLILDKMLVSNLIDTTILELNIKIIEKNLDKFNQIIDQIKNNLDSNLESMKLIGFIGWNINIENLINLHFASEQEKKWLLRYKQKNIVNDKFLQIKLISSIKENSSNDAEFLINLLLVISDNGCLVWIAYSLDNYKDIIKKEMNKLLNGPDYNKLVFALILNNFISSYIREEKPSNWEELDQFIHDFHFILLQILDYYEKEINKDSNKKTQIWKILQEG